MSLVDDIEVIGIGPLATYAGGDGPIPVDAASESPAVVVAFHVIEQAGSSVDGPAAPDAPWSDLGSIRASGGHYMATSAYIADATPPDLTITWGGSGGYPGAGAIAIPTAATAPVQWAESTAGTGLVLAGAPTNGNLLLVFRSQLTTIDALPDVLAGYTLITSGLSAAGDTGNYRAAWIVCGKIASGDSATIITAEGSDKIGFVSEWVDIGAAPVADFSADPTIANVGQTVTFTDLSTNNPTSWAWDFGDGSTSTSQNPTHAYGSAGSYTVTLTATNADGSDSETKVSYIGVSANVGYDPPPSAGALVEIYVHAAGAARWGVAKWGQDQWSGSRWQDVTPQSIDVNLLWGSSQPELGILAQPDADSWAINVYDPERILDPSNVDGPYWSDLRPNLPIRVNHGYSHIGSRTVRTGIVETMSHDFTRPGLGYIRVTNLQSTYANALVPHDTTLADTLFARARAALSAAGLPVKVLDDPAIGDPALVAWEDTGTDQSAWDWIADAAQQVLWVPYFDNHGWLGFRDYRNPYPRNLNLDASRLISLMSSVSYSGLFARVRVTDDTTPAPVVVERFTATEYGNRTYTRSNPTPNASDWADTVLEDRAIPGLRWIPGQIYPLTKSDVDDFARVYSTELMTIRDDYTDPVVIADVIVVGGEIVITAKKNDEAKWWFTFHTAQTAQTPLAEDGADPIEYLTRDGGADTDYVYPDH